MSRVRNPGGGRAGSRLRTEVMRPEFVGGGGALCGIDVVQGDAVRQRLQVVAVRVRLQVDAGAADQVQRPVAGLIPRVGVRAASQQQAQRARSPVCAGAGRPGRQGRRAQRPRATHAGAAPAAASGQRTPRCVPMGAPQGRQASFSRAHAASYRLHQVTLFRQRYAGARRLTGGRAATASSTRESSARVARGGARAHARAASMLASATRFSAKAA